MEITLATLATLAILKTGYYSGLHNADRLTTVRLVNYYNFSHRMANMEGQVNYRKCY